MTESLVNLPYFKPFPIEFLENNCTTLTELNINTLQIVGGLDCKVFEGCINLRKLLLYAQPKSLEHFVTKEFQGVRAKSELSNIESLPKSLSFLLIVNFCIETKDTVLFTKASFPALNISYASWESERRSPWALHSLLSRSLRKTELRLP
jgi:hypothetical protein